VIVVSKKILNLYAGMGGNRKLWDEVMDINVTAVEWNEKIADIYRDFFPQDKVVTGDAINYFENNFHKFDFVWASPPCKTHSRVVRFNVARRYNGEDDIKVKLPDWKLFSLINFLNTYFKGDWIVENTYSDYKAPTEPQRIARHNIWSNKTIQKFDDERTFHNIEEHQSLEDLCFYHNFDYERIKDWDYKGDKKQILRNCVHPELGKHILECAFKKKQLSLEDIND